MKPKDAQTAVVRILYFARLREALGREGEELVLPEQVADVATLVNFLRSRGGAWASELRVGKVVRVAVNQEMAQPGTPIREGDEIALFPPVTGG
jgi:sulfur-carrier protein